MNKQPIVLRYTSGRETFAVHADGLISRPAIGMEPSGGWRLTGVATGFGRRVASFPELCRALAETGTAAPVTLNKALNRRGGLYLSDLDHGTHRLQRAPGCKGVWLEPGADLALVDRLDIEREKAADERRVAEMEATRERVRAADLHYKDSRYPVALYRLPGRPALFGLIDGETAQADLNAQEAAAALGAALIWHADEDESGGPEA